MIGEDIYIATVCKVQNSNVCKGSQMELTLHSNIELEPLDCNTSMMGTCFKDVA